MKSYHKIVQEVAELCVKLNATFSQVHDSFVINVPERNKAALLSQLQEIMK